MLTGFPAKRTVVMGGTLTPMRDPRGRLGWVDPHESEHDQDGGPMVVGAVVTPRPPAKEDDLGDEVGDVVPTPQQPRTVVGMQPNRSPGRLELGIELAVS